jgi:hypothetical protein
MLKKIHESVQKSNLQIAGIIAAHLATILTL